MRQFFARTDHVKCFLVFSSYDYSLLQAHNVDKRDVQVICHVLEVRKPNRSLQAHDADSEDAMLPQANTYRPIFPIYGVMLVFVLHKEAGYSCSITGFVKMP